MNKINKMRLPSLRTVGERVAWARERARLTQLQLADRIGRTQQHVSALEKNKLGSPGKALIMKVSKELEVPAAWLLFGIEELEMLSEEAIRLALEWEQIPDDDMKKIIQSAVAKHTKLSQQQE